MEWVRSVLAAGGWLLALGALGGSLLAQGGRFSPRLDVLAHLAPLYLAAALLAALSAIVAPRGVRALLLVAVLAAFAGAAALMLPETLSQTQAAAARPNWAGHFKVIQFNAWGRNAKAELAVAWILAQDPDVVVVEEAGRLRDRLVANGFHASCLSCGAVVFSREKPIRSYAEPRREGLRSLMSSSTLVSDAGEVTIVGVHRHWPMRWAKAGAQTADLDVYLASLPKERLILTGDFNSTPWSFARRREDRAWGLVRRTVALPTWPAERVSHNRMPAPFPYLPIDHVYAGPGWATVSVERGPRLGSDHYPVVVVLAPVARPGT